MKRLFHHHNMHGTLLAVSEFLDGISSQLSVIRCAGGGVLQVSERVFDCCTTRALGGRRGLSSEGPPSSSFFSSPSLVTCPSANSLNLRIMWRLFSYRHSASFYTFLHELLLVLIRYFVPFLGNSWRHGYLDMSLNAHGQS